MLATALIIPTVTAAVDALRRSVGIAQNAGRNAMQTLVRLNQKTIVSFGPGRVMRQSNPTALINRGMAACQRLSRVLSECHPLISMAARATMYGTEPSRPTCKSENPDSRFKTVGNQKTTCLLYTSDAADE